MCCGPKPPCGLYTRTCSQCKDFRTEPVTWQIHQSRIWHSQLFCFCCEMLVCQCFSPYGFYFHGYSKEQQKDTGRVRMKRPLAMMKKEMEEEMEGEVRDVNKEEWNKEPLKGAEDSYDGDWLTLVQNDHWWSARTIAVDIETSTWSFCITVVQNQSFNLSLAGGIYISAQFKTFLHVSHNYTHMPFPRHAVNLCIAMLSYWNKIKHKCIQTWLQYHISVHLTLIHWC